MTKLLVLLYILTVPYLPLISYVLSLDEAAMCYTSKKGSKKCLSTVGVSPREICWCGLKKEQPYCTCKDPRFMSKQQHIDHLTYQGKEDEDNI